MEFQELLSKVDQLKLEIANIRPVQPELERRIMEKFRLDWNYHSNAIEGNKLTLGETKAFILDGLTADGKPLKDHLDIKGHDNVITFLADFVKGKEVLTEVVIRGLHKILLHEPYKVEARTPQGGITSKWVKLGEYKTEPNFVITATGETKQFTLPQDTPADMQALMEWFNKETLAKTLHPVEMASIFHHRFTKIHPFDDGNGRLARILMNLILMQNELLPVVIKIENRDQYIAALVKADVGEETGLFNIIAENEIHSQELFLRGARGENISDFEDVDKRLILLKQELRNKEKPAELTTTIQSDFLSKFVKPFIARLTKKMSGFDELFETGKVYASGNFSPGGVGNSRLQWNARQTNHEEALKELIITVAQGHRFHRLDFSFQWQGFQRAGLNTFDCAFQIQITFEKYKYNITATHINGGVFSWAQNMYQILPHEDDIRKLLNTLAEEFLKYIESQIRPKSQLGDDL